MSSGLIYTMLNSGLRIKTKRNKGVALFIALVVAGLLLSIGLAVSFIAFKELSLSNTIRQSQIAFYTSEAGLDCARFWIFEGAPYFDGTSAAIRCGGATRTIGGTGAAGNPYTFNFSITGSGSTQVDLVRIGTTLGRSFDVTTKGYNLAHTNTSDKQVQRLQQYRISGLNRGDFILVVDTSASVCRDIAFLFDETHDGNQDGQGDCGEQSELPKTPSEFAKLYGAMEAFIRNLNIKASGGVKLGVVRANWDAKLVQQLTGSKTNLINNFLPAFWEEHKVAGLFPGANLDEGLRKARLELEGREFTLTEPMYPRPPGAGPCPKEDCWGQHERTTDLSGNPTRYLHGDKTFPELSATSHLREQNDTSFPDFVVVIADGAPDTYTIDPGDGTCSTSAVNATDDYEYKYGAYGGAACTNFSYGGVGMIYSAVEAARQAQLLRNANITVIVVGVGVQDSGGLQPGPGLSRSDYLRNYIASDPSNYIDAEFDDLETILSQLALGIIPIVIN